MRKMLSSALVSVFLLAGYAPLTAQSGPGDEAEIVAAAVTHMIDTMRVSYGARQGPIGFDSRVVEPREVESYGGPATVYELTGRRADRVTASVLAQSGTSAGDFDSASVCATESLRSCTLRDHVALFAASMPVVVGDTANVFIKGMWLVRFAKDPVQDGDFLVTLQRDGSGWKAVAMRGLSILQ